MKQLITILLLVLSLTLTARQHRLSVSYNDDNTGWCIAGTGMVFSIVALTVPDGSNWTYSQYGYGGTYVRRPFFKQPSRVCMLGFGLTLTIGGLIYQRH